jgi:hypothetical protein
MINAFFKSLIGVVAITFSTVILANEFATLTIPSQSTTDTYAKQGFFIGVDVGYGSLGIPSISYRSALYDDAHDNSDYYSTSGGISVGYNFKVAPNALHASLC